MGVAVHLSPNEDWVMQQARNLLMWLEEAGLAATHLIHDRDTKFTRSFDCLLDSADIRIVKPPVMAPNANAFAESWIATVRRECLNYFICFNLRHADHIVQAFASYYNEYRPHQSLGNRPLDDLSSAQVEEVERVSPVGRIGCRSELGGLLKHHSRLAA